ncbi:MAG TPA: FkbM family methyltransferase, partial [Chitinophagaceae bacterium]|nr:FkbM family methyltransferase [Chitinophagaceae bacterium]
MLIAKGSITYEVQPGFSIHDGREYWDLVNGGSWEPETFNIMQQYLSPKHSYIDIGAWVGPTVLFGAQLAKECYAVEADPVAYSGLLKNLSLNPVISNVHADNVAISSATGFAEIGCRITKGDG